MANGVNPPELTDFWEKFGDYSDYIEVSCDFTGSLAVDVLNHFGIETRGTVGGTLMDIDIKNMDALAVIKLSLLEASADSGKYYEFIMSSDGYVEFKEIGNYSGSISDVYYSMQTSSYVEECVGVMVTGKKPLPERKVLNWKPIWGDLPASERIYDTSDMMTNCNMDNFSAHATIVYNDPHITLGTDGYEDGIDNLFEHGGSGDEDLGPFDSVLGYARWKNPPAAYTTTDTVITHRDTASIPVRVDGPFKPAGGADIGVKLALPPTFPENAIDPNCWKMTMEAQWEDGVEVLIPERFRFETARGVTVDKFVGIEKVYLIGKKLSLLRSIPKDDAAAVKKASEINDEDLLVYASIDDPNTVMLELERGQHYEVAYKDGQQDVTEDVTTYKTPYLVFVDNGEYGDPQKYGNGPDRTGVRLRFTANCSYIDENGLEHQSGDYTVLPLGSRNGFIINEIWALLNLETPSITIYDPNGGGAQSEFGGINNRALLIAENYDYQIAPMVIVDAPPPIGYNGRLIDQTQHIQDHDPTTAQSFEDTDYNLALDEMNGGGGMSINLSFLEENQVVTLSEVLYEYMNSLDGQETVYTCGPECDPELGGYGPNGGIINQINYSYADSQAYTISVTEGPRLLGQMATIGTGPYPIRTESPSMEGIITQDLGNHIHFMVNLDAYGERVAINCCEKILRVGDRVSCTVHNAPVES